MPDLEEQFPAAESNLEHSKITIHIGKVGASELTEVQNVPVIFSPEGYIGLHARTIGRVAAGQPGSSIIWIKPPISQAESQSAPNKLEFVNGSVVLDRGKLTVDIDGVDSGITGIEFKLFDHLAQNAGRVVSKEEIINEFWNGHVHERTPYVHILHIRKKLGDYAWIIRTRYNRGFILDDTPLEPPRDEPQP